MKVDNQIFIEGVATAPNANVWIIIHPVEVSMYWIQKKVLVQKNGSFRGERSQGPNFYQAQSADSKF